MVLSIVSQVSIAALAGLVLWAAASDTRRYLIPNRVVTAIAGLWLIFATAEVAAGTAPMTVAKSLMIGLIAFVAGFGLFMARLLGGGDVKLFSAIALWAGADHGLVFTSVTVLAGGMLALTFLTLRTLRAMYARTLAPESAIAGGPPNFVTALARAAKSDVPFGIAIAAGGLVVAYRLLFGVLAS